MGLRTIKIGYASEYLSRKREESTSSKASSTKLPEDFYESDYGPVDPNMA
jgi:hypothetical protein